MCEPRRYIGDYSLHWTYKNSAKNIYYRVGNTVSRKETPPGLSKCRLLTSYYLSIECVEFYTPVFLEPGRDNFRQVIERSNCLLKMRF